MKKESSETHGVIHAENTAALVMEILESYPGLPKELTSFLPDVARGHDQGYIKYEPYWSGTQHEHPWASTKLFMQWFDQLHASERSRYIGGTLTLNHDRSMHIFPAYHRFEAERDGRPPLGFCLPSHIPGVIVDLPPEVKNIIKPDNPVSLNQLVDLDIFRLLLQVIQEADSRLADAERTLKFCRERGIPLSVTDYDQTGIGIPAWQASGAANILLALNAMLLNAITLPGQQDAHEKYQQGIRLIKRLVDPDQQRQIFLGELSTLDIHRVFEANQTKWANNQEIGVYWDAMATPDYTRHYINNAYGLTLRSYTSQVIPMSAIHDVGSDLPSSCFSTRDPDFCLSSFQIWDRFLTNYAVDYFTQIPAQFMIGVYRHDEISPKPVEIVSVIPPIVSPASDVNPLAYQLITGSDLFYQAKEINREFIRVLIPQM